MTKKIAYLFSLFILLSVFPTPLVLGETIEDTPTSESTLSTTNDDPLKEIKERVDNHASTLESTEKTPSTESSDKEETSSSKEEVKNEESPASEEKLPPRQTRALSIHPRFAYLLRTNKSMTNNGGPWSGYGKSLDALTTADMLDIRKITLLNGTDSCSFEGIELAENLEEVDLASFKNDGQISSKMDLRNCSKLKRLSSSSAVLSSIYLPTTIEHIDANSIDCRITTPLNTLTNLKSLKIISRFCESMLSVGIVTLVDLEELDIGTPSEPRIISSVNVQDKPKLKRIGIWNTSITSLDLTKNLQITDIELINNPLTNLALPNLSNLERFTVTETEFTDFDLQTATKLTYLNVANNKLTELDISNNSLLKEVYCTNNKISELATSDKLELTNLACEKNELTKLEVHSPKVRTIVANENLIKDLDVSGSISLENLNVMTNQISDISSLNGLTSLKDFNVANQAIYIPAPIINNNKGTIDLLKTTNRTGLTLSHSNANHLKKFKAVGDKIEFENMSLEDLDTYPTLRFQYPATQLAEGTTGGTRYFNGYIRFEIRSDVFTELVPSARKVSVGDRISWKWTLGNNRSVTAQHLEIWLNLPPELELDPSSVKRDGWPTAASEIINSTNLGNIWQGTNHVYTFDVIVKGGAVGDWLVTEAKTEWDDTLNAKYGKFSNPVQVGIQIKDDEQIEYPKDDKELAILSLPKFLNFGTRKIESTAKSYMLDSSNYGSNTNVVSEGFRTRIKNDRTTNAGWKLTAQLSDFVDISDNVMPNSNGISLTFDDLTIESIVDRDTPSEAINPSPTGIPTFQTTETLVAGQTAKSLISASVNRGKGTWQLRIPFDKVQLNVPMNAGKTSEEYRANLTWSLDDTP